MTTKKTPAKKATIKTTAKKTAAKKAPAKKAVTAKTKAVKKTAVKKVAAKKPAVKKAPAKKIVAAKKAAPKKTQVKKTAAKKATAKPVAKVLTPAKPSYTESVKAAASLLFQLRAQKLQLLDLRGITDTADFMIIATCESEAQMQAILNELSKEFKSRGIESKTEYKPGINMRWAVFDAGFDLMVQLFEETKREELAFDKLYGDAKITDLDEKDFIADADTKVEKTDEFI
ncbi:MAG: ribosome silencing factor [Fibrobacteraceae bacterium]|nr:ribosome silencing factor [Fibrobacteraceae bacterium]